MSTPDEILRGLDAEQHQAATALHVVNNLIGEFTTGAEVLAEIERQATGTALVRG